MQTNDWPADFAAALRREAETCLQQVATTDKPVLLVSVGGFDGQDLPMSGSLQPSKHLQACPNLQALLGCVVPPLGRVCLFRQTGTASPASPLYQNEAHGLFYQTHFVLLTDTACLLLETETLTPPPPLPEGEEPGSSTGLFDLTGLPPQPLAALETIRLNVVPPRLAVLSPAQVGQYLDTVLTHCLPCLDEADSQALTAHSESFLQRWQHDYAQFGDNYAGEWSYQSALNMFRDKLLPLANTAGKTLPTEDRQAVGQALKIITSQLNLFPPSPRRVNRQVLLKARRRQQFQVGSLEPVPRFERPVFIVSAPRAGSTLLFETLSQFQEIWSTGEENHALLEDIPGLHPHDHGFASNRLEAADATGSVRGQLLQAFTGKLQDREQRYYLTLPAEQRPTGIRFLEKTPKNALRIPFIKALFPDALFVYLQRDFRSNVSSLIDGWRSQRFVAYRDLPGFASRHWSFLLIPGWQTLHDRSIAEIACQQWNISNRIIRDDLAQLPEQDWMGIDYHDLITQPETLIRQFAAFAGLAWDQVIQSRCENGLPVSRLTLSSPQQDKWKKHLHLLDTLPMQAAE